MNTIFFVMLSAILLPSNYMVLKYSLAGANGWSNKRVFELTMVMWALTLVACAVLKDPAMARLTHA